jgi:hypothetical protein
MSLSSQDNARASFPQQNNPQQRIVFGGQPNLSTPPSAQQQRVPYPRPQGGIRVSTQHKSPYSTPYAPSNIQVQTVPPRQNGLQNGNGEFSAEQQIAQGVLSNPSSGSGSNTPQRRPPPLGNTIHMPHGTPQQQQQQPMSLQSTPMNINHAMNPTPTSLHQAQRQSQNGSPALQHLNSQRSAMTSSPVNSNGNMVSRPQDASPHEAHDMSMIDPQLAIDQQLSDPNSSMMQAQQQSHQILQTEHSPIEPVLPENMLSAPPGGSYPTFEALFAAAQSHALSHGYAFVIGRSKRDNRGLKKVFLICDRGGNNKEKVPGEARQRKTKSRKCGCEFGVFGLETKTAWILRGRIDGEHLSHNHPPSDSPTEHPGARKLDPKAIAAVKALEENGMYFPSYIYKPRY